MIWSKEETLPREEIEKIQLERLQETVNRVYERVPAYRKKMDEAGIKPEDIKSLKDLSKLPLDAWILTSLSFGTAKRPNG